ncbi:galactose-1-phosphate uridylyltransferase [Paenibacillus montaniterrae]|uniref:Galactose-1-phosphate uridylyltransferase n=1 Tax=Paenibacillus montaniterrae TaxID=429341 RepID=A0A919YKY3_9BACL|nr:UDP-glucose--hexose-1-phosphate uridylyltransferase [Paenibacillus montaniterrae]GIP16322.1 galactose-1-phosphate uridylyltransferase [Paenibacillus montaniterrae]
MTAQVTATDAQLQIARLVQFALQQKMIEATDQHYATNALLDLFHFEEPYEGEVPAEQLASPVEPLEQLLDYGYSIGLIPENTLTYRDLLDAKVMGVFVPRPSELIRKFYSLAEEHGIEAATTMFYKLSIDSNYIRMDRIAKNPSWLHATEYGELQITVNLSKPEKDPKEIALLKTLPPAKYPKCLLCVENVGYAGRVNHPARQNHRTIPLTLQGEEWHLQYSPYVYYNEHSIVLKGEHDPMAVTHSSMARLLDFVEQFPHYFIGSNADLPIVGGSILSHDHFQAGKHVFPMETSPIEMSFSSASYPGVKLGIVKWPMSVIRLQGQSKDEVKQLAAYILDQWREYSDPSAQIYAFTKQADGSKVPHNTITPIARLLSGGEFELDLVLRNNRTSEEHPDGIFHPHQNLHHIKKENIGLIEVMGLAVLPGRLKEELAEIAALLSGGDQAAVTAVQSSEHPLNKHAAWISELAEQYGISLSSEAAEQLVKEQTGAKFLAVLQDAGVYKRDVEGLEAFKRFIKSLDFTEML